MRWLILLWIGLLPIAQAQVPGKVGPRTLAVDDFLQLQQVSDPQVSPDGDWVLYVVNTADISSDRRNTDLWVVKWDGSERRQLTFSAGSESAPRWRPDGKAVSYLLRPSEGKAGAQVWQLPLDTGRPQQITRLPGQLTAYEWAPDGARLVLVYRATEQAEKEGNDGGGSKPLVIDRYLFKRDGVGYLAGVARSQLYLYDVQKGQAERLTADGDYEESNPAWSPDGRRIAFVSNHDADWERTRNSDVFVVESRAGARSSKLTHHQGIDGGYVVWSPDGSLVAYGQGSEQKLDFHNFYRLAVVPSQGGETRVLTDSLDRGVSAPVFSADGTSLAFLVTDDRTQYLARVAASGGAITPVLRGPRTLQQLSGQRDHLAVLGSSDTQPSEIHAVENGKLRSLSVHNTALVRQIQLAKAEDIEFQSPDGTVVRALLTLPAGHSARKPLPTLVWVHGGPNAQDSHAFQFERQLFAAQGYAVLSINYRGSSGRGAAFAESIFADWGQLEVQDVLAGVDHLVASGIADPGRLGIGGWSYGGLLTDYVIASDTRFKAAVSGAGSANHLSLYGHDQYTHLYDSQFGPPWKDTDLWLKFSYPFFKADRIVTPTLFLGGDQDFNVPILGSEQMYQALKYLKVPTQLVVYPGENHRLVKPSFERDRYLRYLDWFGRYLAPDVP